MKIASSKIENVVLPDAIKLSEAIKTKDSIHGNGDDHLFVHLVQSKDTEERIKNTEEFSAEENWKGTVLPIKKRKRSSYLEKNSEWLEMNLNESVRSLAINIIRNGSCPDLKTVKIEGLQYIFTNTCGFDAIVHLIACNWCDYPNMSNIFKFQETRLGKLIEMCFKTINTKLYKLRAELLLDLFKKTVTQYSHNLIQIDTQSTIEYLIRSLCQMGELQYSLTEKRFCNQCNRVKLLTSPDIPVAPHLNLNIVKELHDVSQTRKCTNTDCDNYLQLYIRIQ
ncbi:uncharacterized protein LOC116182178 [Photinus pyralis]|uniref:uncharacterized protein LOC116182178 n=1 Tax=Photinus pyralis TaxID=7054 RepID=UPI001266FFEC|nr:uncharacterized protein LOC116182178 [Photinus pyralis]